MVGGIERKIVNPMTSLDRTEKVVQTIYKRCSVDMPIKKVLINREGYIDYRYAPNDLEIIDRRHYEAWFMSLRQLTMPLKHMQLKAAQSLLTYCDARYYDPLVVEQFEEADE
ncbi:hypothetical protein LR68_02034 [Anoxybacillus sp. BCO1]|nr:hypothetical protein LR68_02034 [Anoxybacillus sp. BCO1]